MAHQLEEYARAGMDGWVAKPIQAEVLFDALNRCLTATEAAGDAHDTAAA
jgi:CheY-like chemotaxis protein